VKNLTKIKYIAFQGGGEAITQLLGGHVQAYTGDVSEIQGHLESGGILHLDGPEFRPRALNQPREKGYSHFEIGV